MFESGEIQSVAFCLTGLDYSCAVYRHRCKLEAQWHRGYGLCHWASFYNKVMGLYFIWYYKHYGWKDIINASYIVFSKEF